MLFKNFSVKYDSPAGAFHLITDEIAVVLAITTFFQINKKGILPE